MHFTRARAALLIVIIALLAAACSSSDGTNGTSDGADSAVNSGDSAVAADAADAGDTASEPEAAGDTAGNADDAASGQEPAPVPVPGDAESADGVIDDSGAITLDPVTGAAPTGDPISNSISLVRSLFNVDPDADAAQCILDEAENRPGLQAAIDIGAASIRQLTEEELVDITYGINGCVAPELLGGWATEAVNPSADVRETAPACFGSYFADPEMGDALFNIFVALSFQFRYEPDLVPAITDAFVECTPVTGLVDFLANEAETATGFATLVDRDCLRDEFADPEVSRTFWTTLIEGFEPPINSLQQFVDTCTSTAADGWENASIPADFVPWSGTGTLATVVPFARAQAYTAPPPMTIDPTASYEAVLTTGGGEVRIRLLPEHAPVTVNNFVNLARDGYFDGTVFHRVIDGFMAQGGDPTGTGTGGPGYQFADEIEGGPPLERAGLLAMANSGPGTNGSQFFITFASTEWLTGNHTVFGEVISGQEIVDVIERREPSAPSGPGQRLDSVVIIEN